MTDPLSFIARRLVDASSFREELAQFVTWLVAKRYAPFVVEQHVRRMDFILLLADCFSPTRAAAR
ncbi:MAG TPA: hypothetical protein VFO82_15765 [Steroidobacteraceae bacterium]|nr:hypothetical protein [Steroidobacteraceae bacterium]